MLATIAGLIWDRLEPFLIAKWKEVEPKLFAWLDRKWDEFAPKILKTILVGLANGAGQLTVSATDKVTDIIPGPVDDAIIDPIVERGVQQLKDFFPGIFR